MLLPVDIFDTLSDVSTDDSDIQITHESNSSKNQPPPAQAGNVHNITVISLDSNSDTENEVAIVSQSLDYLISPPNCVIVQKIDYVKYNTDTFPMSDCSSLSCTSDTSDSDSDEPVIHVDNDLSFIIDGVLAVPVVGSTDDCKAADTDSKTRETGQPKRQKRKRKSQTRFPNNPELRDNSRMFKYWSQRYDLFERFDMGIKLDKESWYSVTPEYIAKEQAQLCRPTDTVVDAFCGAGGNTIQFAYNCDRVIAFDIDRDKVELARNNCAVYGVDMTKVAISKEDFFAFADLHADLGPIVMPPVDVVFLSPPWGGQDYLVTDGGENSAVGGGDVFDVERLLTVARKFRPTMIIVYLPRNTDETRLQSLARPNETLQVVHHLSRYKKTSNKKVKAITAVYKCEY